LRPDSQRDGFAIPPGVSLEDGLSEDDAVAIALWNNAAFQTDLTSLGFARADLAEAGQLRNPVLTLLLPWGPKQLEFTAGLPFEFLWQRPRRVAAAKLDLERVGESLVQTGLNLVRDVRVAYVDSVLASERVDQAAGSLGQRTEIARIVEARLRAGDISELETISARTDTRLAEEQLARFKSEAALATNKLRLLLGMESGDPTFTLVADAPGKADKTNRYRNVAFSGVGVPIQRGTSDEVNDLIRQALAARPDLRAAELAIEAAGKRAKWERSRILAISVLLDANAQGKDGFEAGPGLQGELPILNRNKGGIKRAEAEIKRAARHYIAVRHRIAMEVRQTYEQLAQAQVSLQSWRRVILPQVEEEIRISERAYSAGQVSYLFVLETSRRLADVRMQDSDTAAAVRRARAELDRAVGRRISETR
jgi:cobalt-zinc-cadmium efflux system outer membrane protein